MGLVFISSVVAAFISRSGSDFISGEDVGRFVDETMQDITSYISVTEVMGRFEGDDSLGISKIAFYVKPMFSQDIDISSLTMRIDEGDDLFFYQYDDDVQKLDSSGLFSYSLWDEVSEAMFGVIVVHDEDDSIEQYHVLNDRSDMIYIIVNVPYNHRLNSGESVDVTLLQTSGIQKTIALHVPLPMKRVVTLAKGFY
jgi:archaellin